MSKPKDDVRKPFQLDWKSLGFGIIAGAFLLTIIMMAGGRVEEWNFGVVKVVIPTPTSNSHAPFTSSESERAIESFPVKLFKYDGLKDINVNQGRADLSLAYPDQTPRYLFDYDLPSDGTYGYAGLTFRFDESQDFSDYKSLRVVLDYLDDTALCELYINDISPKGDFYLLGRTNIPGGVLKINGTEYTYDIELSNFVKPDFKAIYEIGLSVDTDITRGGHRIVLKQITFVR